MRHTGTYSSEVLPIQKLQLPSKLALCDYSIWILLCNDCSIRSCAVTQCLTIQILHILF